MSLAEYQPTWTQVTTKGRPLAKVRGLNLIDLSALVSGHLATMQEAYDVLLKAGLAGEKISIDADRISLQLVLKFPILVSVVICMAAEDEGEGATAGVRRMPAPLQVKILVEIMKLTFEDVGGPLELIALVKTLGTNATGGARNRIQ